MIFDRKILVHQHQQQSVNLTVSTFPLAFERNDSKNSSTRTFHTAPNIPFIPFSIAMPNANIDSRIATSCILLFPRQ